MTTVSDKFLGRLLCLSAIAASVGSAFAGPAGPVVSAGSATYVPATLTITSTSARTQIGWQSFNVSANEVVKFVQPSAQSSVLNRVFNPQSLNLLGSVTSNGSVLFLGNGIVLGSDLNLNLAGMVSTSLRLPQMALAQSGIEPVARTSALATLAGGRIQVIGEDPQALTMASGDVVLNPGKTIELANAAMPNLRVVLSAPNAEAINLSRLVGEKSGTGIFAALFRLPAAARQAGDVDVGTTLTASAEENTPVTPGMERFLRYALMYAQMRGGVLQDEGGMIKVAAASSARMVLPAARSRPSPLPQAIEIGAPAVRPREAAVELAPAPVAAESAQVATLQPQPVAVASESESEPNGATLVALAPAAGVERAAALEPPPVAVHQAPEPEDLRMVAGQLAAAQPLAQPEHTQVAQPGLLSEHSRHESKLAPAVIVVALAHSDARPAVVQVAQVKEVRIERRAPRYFTDHRGAMFFM